MIQVDGIYIHFPFCQHLCNYCDFYKFKYDVDKLLDFENSLSKNLSIIKDSKFDYSRLKTIYFGGGTPSLWKTGLINQINLLSEKLNIDFNTLDEVTMEVDPDTWEEQDIDNWLKAGVKRFSIGVQAFDERVLRKLDRRHSLGDIEKTLKYFSERNLNFSVDLLLGAPIKERNLEKEINDLLKYQPKHFSTYILKTRANYPHQNELPSDEEAVADYEIVYKCLKANGFVHYEVSNFAKKGFESTHNISYWQLKNVLAIGPNATGFYQENNQNIRYQVAAHSGEFKNEILNDDAYVLEKIYLALRTNLGINPSLYFTQKQWSSFDEVLARWSKDALLEAREYTDLKLSSKGFLVLDSFMDELFRYSLL